jgi:ABC-type branched-subunit amino acid transport system substrate-binding protein
VSGFWWAFCLGLVLLGGAALIARDGKLRGEAQAADPPISIGMLVSSRSDQCYDRGDVGAIRRLVGLEQERINKAGGIAGRRLEVQFLDDGASEARTLALLGKAIEDPNMLALVGLSNSARAKAVFGSIGDKVRDSGIPFLSDISVNSIFEKAPNVFTMRASQESERLPVITQFVAELEAQRLAFVGLKGTVFSETLGDGIKAALGGILAADHRLSVRDNKIDPAEVERVVADLVDKKPDLIFVSVGTSRAELVISELRRANVTPPLFISGRLDRLPQSVTSTYPNDLYQIAFEGLPELYSDRVRRLIPSEHKGDWRFEGQKVAEAPGWRTGGCEERPAAHTPSVFEAANLRAIGVGSQYADMVGLIAASTRRTLGRKDTDSLRQQVLSELRTSYAAGRGAYKGSFENWSFHQDSRAATRTPMIVMLPRGLGRTQLAPVQFARLKKSGLRRIDTMYLDVDLIRAYRIEDNEKTFFAEFYLSMHDGKGASIDRIEFTNAFLDPRTNDRQITVRTLHGGGKSAAYPENMKIYQISGRFLFDPQLATYPFDTQRFAIDIQPKRGDAPFIVQPPPLELRDKAVATDGWDAKEQFVGYDEDFVPVIDPQTHEPSMVPFYKTSFVWMMKRQTTDYYLRVVVPLAFILIIAYMSIFIPQGHFEAVVTIQVTALLSAVALYLSLPKLDADTATLSDRLFVFDYMLVSLMIGISILRVNRLVAPRKWLYRTLGFVHVTIIPLLVGLVAAYIWRLSDAAG